MAQWKNEINTGISKLTDDQLYLIKLVAAGYSAQIHMGGLSSEAPSEYSLEWDKEDIRGLAVCGHKAIAHSILPDPRAGSRNPAAYLVNKYIEKDPLGMVSEYSDDERQYQWITNDSDNGPWVLKYEYVGVLEKGCVNDPIRHWSRGVLAHLPGYKALDKKPAYARVMSGSLAYSLADLPKLKDSVAFYLMDQSTYHIWKVTRRKQRKTSWKYGYRIAARRNAEFIKSLTHSILMQKYKDKDYSSRCFPPVLRTAIIKRDDYRCQICGTHRDQLPESEKLEIDHIIEYHKGGPTSYENGQTVCSSCNKGKHHAIKNGLNKSA